MKYGGWLVLVICSATLIGWAARGLHDGPPPDNAPSTEVTDRTSLPSINLTCKADGGVDAFTISGLHTGDYVNGSPDWASKICGPIRKATYPPPTPPASASNDSCWDAETQKVTDGPCGGTGGGGHMTPFVNPYDHMGENGTPG